MAKKVIINKWGLKRELAEKGNRFLRERFTHKAKDSVKRAAALMLAEFENHAVTRELEGGPGAQNISKTLGGVGNLFSYIGFDVGDEPITPIRRILEDSVKLIKVKQAGKTLKFEIVIEIPDKKDIDGVSPIPWAAARSWVAGIEHGLSGLGQYLAKSGAGRSGGGVQIKGTLRSGGFRNQPYISSIIKSLHLNLKKFLLS